MSEFLTNTGAGKAADADKAARAERLKVIIERLAAGESPAAVKKSFHDLIKGADAAEVASLEQSLIEGGMPVAEVQRLCEVHADVFRAGLERGEKPEKMSGHPVHTYMAENREAKKRSTALMFASFGNVEKIRRSAENLKPIITHYERKENQLFPFLEKTGFTGPSKVMWGKHDEIRAAFRDISEAVERMDSKKARSLARDLARKIKTMIFMEERILFPNALKRLSDADWAAVYQGEPAIGFAWVKPGSAWDPALPLLAKAQGAAASGATASGSTASWGRAPSDAYNPVYETDDDGSGTGIYAPAEPSAPVVPGPHTDIPLATGSLPLDVLDRILKSLPCDVSFVDANDKVRYYSDSPHRVFPRSPGIIGRDVSNCHPPKSVAIVEKILEAFKNKEKDKADFWIEMGGKFIFISYKPIYDDAGTYLGTLEMSMDATELRSLQGQRRLLDW